MILTITVKRLATNTSRKMPGKPNETDYPPWTVRPTQRPDGHFAQGRIRPAAGLYFLYRHFVRSTWYFGPPFSFALSRSGRVLQSSFFGYTIR
jgi:hypothetical protein